MGKAPSKHILCLPLMINIGYRHREQDCSHFNAQIDQLQKTAYNAATDFIAGWLDVQYVVSWICPS
jgi:hypothetical protein